LPATSESTIDPGTKPFSGGHLFHDRRQYPRVVPTAPLLVHVGEYTGLLSNLCEGGLAVNSRFPEIQGEVFCLAVELPGSSSPMRATAQTSWTSDSENRTGVRFIYLSSTSRQHLREWMSAQATATVKERPPTFRALARHAQLNLAAVYRQLTSLREWMSAQATATMKEWPPIFRALARHAQLNLAAVYRQLTSLREWMSAQATATMKEWPPTFRALARDAQFNLAAVYRQLTSGVERTELKAAWRHAGLFRLTVLVLTVAALCSALVFLGYRLGRRSEYQRTQTPAPRAKLADPHARGQVEPAKLSPATNPSPPKFHLDVPGFVLQVGAMTNESNAEAMSETLQRNNFPAFVFKRSTDRFYQVNVGSFADADSAAVVKRQLEKQGFKAILRYWSP